MAHRFEVVDPMRDDYYAWVYKAYNAIPEYLHINDPKEDFENYYKCKFIQNSRFAIDEFIEFEDESEAVLFKLRWIDQ